MTDHRIGTITSVDQVTALCGVTVDGTSIIALALGRLSVVGATVIVEQRGTHKQDWVINGTQPPSPYFEQWDYNGFSVPNNAGTNVTPQNSMFLIGPYASAWSGATWTAPEAAPYIWTVVGHPLGSATNRAYVRVKTGGGVVLFETDQGALPASLWCTATGCEWFPLGQTMQVEMFQNSGGAQVQDAVARVSIMKLPL